MLESTPQKPNRLKDKKDKLYHNKYGRWAAASYYSSIHQNFIIKSLINWNFYKNNQWDDQQIETFLKDESGEHRNRIKVSKNLIRPIVEYFKGNAVRTTFKSRAKSYSPFVINKRESKLAEVKFAHAMIGLAPNFEEKIRDTFPIGNSETETEDIFMNTWQDDYEKTMNYLIKYIESNNDLDELKFNAAERLAITGLSVIETTEHNGEVCYEITDEFEFFFDHSAKKKDLSDADFMGKRCLMLQTDVLERFQDIEFNEVEAIEKYSSGNITFNNAMNLMNSYIGNVSNKIPVFKTYWRDIEYQEYGYVKDPYGYEMFTRINDKDGLYTDKDLVEPISEKGKKIVGDKKKTKIYVDNLRYCIFIPKEYIGSTKLEEDIVLEYGVVPYQEKYLYSPSNVSFPFKCTTWGYHNGEILSPVDDAINPQILINRMLSLSEAEANNSTMTTLAISKDAVDPDEGEEGMARNIKQGKPIFIDTSKTGSVQNSATAISSSINSSGIQNYLGLASQMQLSIQEMIGVNEAMTGTAGGQQLGVVLQNRIQQGSLIQEPFYFALERLFKQVYQSICGFGKRVYLDNERELSIAVGDEGVQILSLEKDMLLQDFRIELVRIDSEANHIQLGNEFLITMMQLGMIKDEKLFVNLYGRTTVEEASRELRNHFKKVAEANRMMEQSQAANNQITNAQLNNQIDIERNMVKEDKQREDIKIESDRQHDIDKMLLKSELKRQENKEKI